MIHPHIHFEIARDRHRERLESARTARLDGSAEADPHLTPKGHDSHEHSNDTATTRPSQGVGPRRSRRRPLRRLARLWSRPGAGGLHGESGRGHADDRRQRSERQAPAHVRRRLAGHAPPRRRHRRHVRLHVRPRTFTAVDVARRRRRRRGPRHRRPDRRRGRSRSTAAPATTRSSAATAPTRSVGGGGNDFVDGNQGADTALLGGGNDTFQWDPGDGSDTVEGQAGTDVLQFNGSNIGESIDVSANGGRVRFIRNIATITMDLDDVERLNVARSAAPTPSIVNDLAGTGVKLVDADLSATHRRRRRRQPTPSSSIGTSGDDRVTLARPAATPTVTAWRRRCVVEGAEAAHDDVNVATLGGDDTITTGTEVFGPAAINVDGGDGTDIVRVQRHGRRRHDLVAPNGTEVSTSSAPGSAARRRRRREPGRARPRRRRHDHRRQRQPRDR